MSEISNCTVNCATTLPPFTDINIYPRFASLVDTELVKLVPAAVL